jgi:hypothetical protein
MRSQGPLLPHRPSLTVGPLPPLAQASDLVRRTVFDQVETSEMLTDAKSYA